MELLSSPVGSGLGGGAGECVQLADRVRLFILIKLLVIIPLGFLGVQSQECVELSVCSRIYVRAVERGPVGGGPVLHFGGRADGLWDVVQHEGQEGLLQVV